MSISIRLRRGNHANLPVTGMAAGEPFFTLDRGNLHAATDATTRLPVTPAVDELVTLSTVTPGDDFLMIHDASESGQKEKKITFAAFKAALNIPEESSDELVATSDGAASGYLSEVLVDDGATTDITEAAGVMTVSVPTGGITATQLASDAVTTVKILDANVTAAKLATGSVIEAKIASNAVTTAKINDAAVTNAKLAASALNLNSTHFSGNGVTTQLDIAVVDGGSF